MTPHKSHLRLAACLVGSALLAGAGTAALAQNNTTQQILRAAAEAAAAAARAKAQQQGQQPGQQPRPGQQPQPNQPAQGRGPATTTQALVAGLPMGPGLDIHGAGSLMFGETLQWRLIAEPPAQVRRGDGIKMGGVLIESADGRTRYRLSDSIGFSNAENGPKCTVDRLGAFAIIRCDKDYVFNTETGAPPVKIWPQVNDRGPQSKNPPWVDEAPLPWWKITGLGIKGTTYAFLEYGSTNYGTEVASTPIYTGPALLDLTTGVIAPARQSAQAGAPAYDASSEPESRPVATPSDGDGMTARTVQGNRTIVTVNTTFDRCVDYGSNPCRGDREPRFKSRRPLSYVFEPKP